MPSAEGFNLSVTSHTTRDSAHANVLICAAMGVTAKFYGPYARFLCDQGFNVFRLDYRGMGASQTEPLSECPATMQSWAEADIAATLSWINTQIPDAPIVIVGHSAGGQLAGISNTEVQIDAMLLVASQSGYWKHWSGVRRVNLLLLWTTIIPVLSKLFGRFPARMLGLGNDLPKGAALQWARWGRSPGYIASEKIFADRYSKYTGPILAYSFKDDAFAPARAVKALLSFYSNSSIEHRQVDPQELSLKKIGHFGFFRGTSGDNSLWHDSAEWMKLVVSAPGLQNK